MRFAPLVLGVSVLWLAALTSATRAQEATPPEEIFLTLRPDGVASVRELRSATLVAGVHRLQAYDLSPRILAHTVHIRSLTRPAGVRLVEQSLWYEVLDRQRLLEFLVDDPITVDVDRASRHERIEGTLLLPPFAATPTGEQTVPLFVETPEGIIRVVEDGTLTLAGLPEGRWNRARLDWVLESDVAGRQVLEVCYQTAGLPFEVDYTLRLDHERPQAQLLVTASVRNETGWTFENASLEFQIPDPSPRLHRAADPARRSAHDLYPTSRRTRLEARRSRQVTLVHAAGLATTEAWSVAPFGPDKDVPVVRRIDLANTTQAGLGLPLPAGRLRVLRVDAQGHGRVIAEGRVDASVPGEDLSFYTDPLPGVVAQRRVSGPDSSGTREVTLVIHNERPSAVAVDVLEPLGVRQTARSDQAAVDRSRPGWARLRVDVASRSTTSLRYQVETE